MTTVQSRRRLIVVILLCVAVLGAAIRELAPPSSLTHDLGTLLMVMWVPAVGNIIAYFMKQWSPKPPGPSAFDSGGAFVAERLAEVSFDGPAPDLKDELACTLVQGSEGFTARLKASPELRLPARGSTEVELQFLVPHVALPRFPEGTSFRVLLGRTVVGHGRVLGRLTEA